MKKVLISGYFGYGNFGDEAILQVLIDNLTEVGFKKEDITVLSNNPALTSQIHSIQSINRWNFLDYVISVLNNKCVIFTGGLFQDKTSFASLFYYILQILIAGICQKEIAFYAIGIGPLQRKISQILFNFAVKTVGFITVRDQASSSLIPHKSNIVITCDPAWTIKPDLSFQKNITKINWDLPILGLSIKNDPALKSHHLVNLADRISKIMLSMKEWQVVLIPCMTYEDLPVLYEIYDLILKKTNAYERITIIENFADYPIAQQAGILASTSAMIGMRYHALLIPIANGKPVFGLIYDPKVKSLIEFSSQVGVAFRDNFEQPWNYFWQNIQHSTNMATLTSQRAQQLHKINIELLEALYNL